MTYLGFCCWRGRPAKEASRQVLAQEAALLGKWLGGGLPSWGKVRTHLDRINPFWGDKCLDGGATRAISIAKVIGRSADAWLVEHQHYLGCFLRRRPFVSQLGPLGA